MKSLLIDGNNFIWRAYYGRGLQNYGVSTGILKYISNSVARFAPDELVVCWDVGKSRWRSELFPGYKAARQDKKKDLEEDYEEIKFQAGLTRKLLNGLGIRQASVKGVEADDLLAWLSDYYSRYLRYNQVVIVSTDKDLWQLVVPDRIMVYDPIKNVEVGDSVVLNALGVLPRQVAEHKSLAGDASDGIPGVKGIGPKIAVKLLEEYGSLGEITNFENVGELQSKRKTEKLLESLDDVESYYKIVTLATVDQAGQYCSKEEFEELERSLMEVPQYDPLEVSLVADSFTDAMVDVVNFPRATNSLYHMPKIMDFTKNDVYTWDTLDRSILECTSCSLRADCGEYCPTLPEGVSDVQIMVVARNPGMKDLEEGRPLVGRSGELFEGFLKEVGLTRGDCWITNVCKCHLAGNRIPKYGEVLSCSKYLKSEVRLIQPKFVICFGNEAMSMFTPHQSGVSHHVGEILEDSNGILDIEVPYVAIVNNPSHALRHARHMAEFDYATKKIKEFLEGKRNVED